MMEVAQQEVTKCCNRLCAKFEEALGKHPTTIEDVNHRLMCLDQYGVSAKAHHFLSKTLLLASL